MPRPTDDAEWASTGGTRIEPTEPEKDAGFVPAERTPARKANWIVGILADWVAYFASIIDANDEHTYPTPKARTVWIPGCDFMPSHVEVDGDTETDEQWSIGQAGGYTRHSQVHIGSCQANISKHIGASGCVLARIDVLLAPGAARSGGDESFVTLTRWDFPLPPLVTTAPALTSLGTAAATNTTSRQYLSITGLTETIDRSDDVVLLVVTSGSDAPSAHVPDILHGAYVTFTDPGPRNG